MVTFLGDYPYGEGSSSSDDANSSISESAEPGLDLSSDDEEDDYDDEDEDVEDDVDMTAKGLYKNSDSITVNEVVETHSKTPNLISAKGELNKVNGLKLEKKCDRLRAGLFSPPTNINGLGEVENGCSDSLVISSSSSNNLDAVSKEVDNENRDVDNSGMKNGQMIDPADVIELVSEEGLLDAVKVCADWLYGDSDIIKACGHSSRTLLSRFVTLLNLINVNADAFEKGVYIQMCRTCIVTHSYLFPLHFIDL